MAHFNRRLGLAIIATFCCTSFTASQAAPSQEKTTMAGIEQKLFMKTYDGESDDVRMARIEKQTFGEPLSGSVTERLQRVLGAIGPQKNPDGSMSGLKDKAPRVPPAMGGQPAAPQQEDQATAIQRAQLAVQAAREESINRLLDEGVQLWRAKQSAPAIEKFEEVMRLDPHNAQALFSIGIIYEASGNFIEALSCYRRAAQENPTNKEYADALAAIQGKAAVKSARQDKQSQLKILADDAKVAYDRGEFISALGYYKELDERVPNQALVKYNIGTCYMAMKNGVQALPYYKQARKLRPDDPRYIAACERLEANLERSQQEREQAEAAWAQQDPGGNASQSSGKKNKPPKNSGSNIASPGTVAPVDLMSVLGLVGKSGKGGVVITTVGLASRAYRVALQAGDVIKAVDGQVVKNVDDINGVLSRKPPNSPVNLTVQRGTNLGQVTL